MHTCCPCCCISFSRASSCCCRVSCCWGDQAKDLPLSRTAQSSDVPTGVLPDCSSPDPPCSPGTKEKLFQQGDATCGTHQQFRMPSRRASIEATMCHWIWCTPVDNSRRKDGSENSNLVENDVKRCKWCSAAHPLRSGSSSVCFALIPKSFLGMPVHTCWRHSLPFRCWWLSGLMRGV